MQLDRRHQGPYTGQSHTDLVGSARLLSSTDATCGWSNLGTRPRAGNYSSDTRAG